MKLEEATQAYWEEMREFRASMIDLKGGGSGGTFGGMESRVTKLETQMEFVRDDLKEIKQDLKSVLDRLGQMPTKRDLSNNIFASVAIGLAILAITVGGIVGGLAWLDAAKHSTPPPASSAPQQ